MRQELKHLIDNSEIISFDVFDTAVLRKTFFPQCVFSLMERKLKKKYKRDVSKIANFQQKRIDAERIAREKNISKNNQETTLKEIYKELVEITHLNHRKLSKIMIIEFETELDVLEKNHYIYQVYKYSLDKHKKIIFTSDMYLSKNQIEKILNKCGYNDYQEIFVSSEFKKTKYSSELFKIIQNKFDNLYSKKILHIGDDYHSDFLVPKELGLKSYFYKKARDRFLENKNELKQLNINEEDIKDNINLSIYAAAITNKFYIWGEGQESKRPHRNSFYYDFGYKYVGLLFLGFINWLIDEVNSKKANRIYFLSRDGQIMLKVYDLFREVNNELPQGKYLYASRRACNFAAIEKLDEDSIGFLISFGHGLSIKFFLERIGLDIKEIEDIDAKLKQSGFHSIEDKVISQVDYERLKNLLMLLEKRILEKAKDERQILQEYLDQEGILNESELTIVDIGWHGSMQRSLMKILEKFNEGTKVGIDLKGYYLGIHSNAKKYQCRQNAFGYLYSYGQPHELQEVLFNSIAFIEFLFTADHGTVIKFEKEGKIVKPVLDDSKKEDFNRQIADEMQHGALDFVENVVQIVMKYNLQIEPKNAINSLKRVLEKPTNEEIRKFEKLEHNEGFGEVAVTRNLIEDVSWADLFYFNRFRKKLANSLWKNGLKRKIFLKLGLG